MNDQTEILKELKTLIVEINQTLQKLNVPNKFTATTSTATGTEKGEYISISTAARLLNINITNVAGMIADNSLEAIKQRDGVTVIKKDSVMKYL
jgi:hypothetical protein